MKLYVMEYQILENYRKETYAMVNVIMKGAVTISTQLPLIAVDITVYHDGFHGDLNETFFIGKVDDVSRKLVETTYECMMKGIGIGLYVSVAQKFNVQIMLVGCSSSWREISQYWKWDSETCVS